MTRIRYLVFARGHQFHVYREAEERGSTAFKVRAERFAAALANLECCQSRIPSVVWTERQDGALTELVRFDPPLGAQATQPLESTSG